MVKINITIEGEDISEIINELLHVGIDLLKANRKELREVLKILADESLEILNEKKTLEKSEIKTKECKICYSSSVKTRELFVRSSIPPFFIRTSSSIRTPPTPGK